MGKTMFRAFLIKYAEIAIKGKNRYMFVNSTNDEKQINCALRETGNAKLYSPLENENKPFTSCPDKAGTRYNFTLGGYEVLIITE